MFLKPDYNIESIYAIDLEELKAQGIKALLFDLDSTIMASKSASYFSETREWLDKVKKDFFVGVISNNNNPAYEQKVRAVSEFPMLFNAKNLMLSLELSF